MCARYTMTKVSPDVLMAELGLDVPPPALEPRFNIAPTEDAPIVIESREGERRLGLARFGLVPHWSKDLKTGARMLNARIETVAEKPAFRDALVRHRCLVVADGFYEWRTGARASAPQNRGGVRAQSASRGGVAARSASRGGGAPPGEREGKAKIPCWFHLPHAELFAFAGLWAVWHDPKGERVTSFTILTRPAVGITARIHDRMPVILSPDVYTSWLDRSLTAPEPILALVDHPRAHELEAWVVSTRVNKAGVEDPSLIEPVPDATWDGT